MRSYGTLSSPDDLEGKGGLGYGSIKQQFGGGARDEEEEDSVVDVKAASLVEESDDEIIPFLDDSELETQRLLVASLEAARRGRTDANKEWGKRSTSVALVFLTIVGALGMLLVADRVFASADDSTPVFESSGVVIANNNSSRF
jgi:hypothetical protein